MKNWVLIKAALIVSWLQVYGLANAEPPSVEKSAETISYYTQLIGALDQTTIGGIRKKAVYLSVIARRESELNGFDSAYKITKQIKSHIPACETVGHLEYCETIYHASLGRLYADYGKLNEATPELKKALSLFEKHIVLYEENALYKEVKGYYEAILKSN